MEGGGLWRREGRETSVKHACTAAALFKSGRLPSTPANSASHVNGESAVRENWAFIHYIKIGFAGHVVTRKI